MSDINPMMAIRAGEELNVERLDGFIKAHLPHISGQPKIGQYTSGASNLTYGIDYGEDRFVLRRPPFGTLPKGGHDMQREYRIMHALGPVFPYVPETLFYTDDKDIIGAEFYLMRRSEGHLIHTQIPKEWEWDALKTRALCETFFTRLVDLHQVDYATIGLSGFGRPEGYVERQVLGWNRRWEKAWTPDVENFADVCQWLEDHRPDAEKGAAILHGDFRIDNCILHPDDPTHIKAILDWEISALGDPLMDLGNTLAYWIEADDPPYMQALARQPSQAKGMMTRREILTFYGEKTGADISNFQFYYIYGIWRLAVIIQQIYARYYHGQTDNPKFKPYGTMTKALGELAREKIDTGLI